MNTRAAAALILDNLGDSYRYFEERVAYFCTRQHFKQADRDFIYLMVKGVVQNRSLLDFVIAGGIKRPLAQLEPLALNLLRLGVLQNIILQTPAYAAVNETTAAARELGRRDLAVLVNGFLRNLPPLETWRARLDNLSAAEALAVEYSHPLWLVEKWIRDFGPLKTTRLLQFNNSSPGIIFRHNPIRSNWTTWRAELVTAGYEPECIAEKPVAFFRVNQPGRLLKSTFFKKGYCSVQDYSQSLAVNLLDPQAGETILDVCAAPGGKTTYIAQQTAGRAIIYASDQSERKLAKLQESACRLGLDFINYRVADAMMAEYPQADKILVDAPCSGTGVIARRADLRWNRTPEELAKFPVMQSAILNNVSRFVRPGGALIYSTCTLEAEENWGVAEAFLANHPDFFSEPGEEWVALAFCDERGAVCIRPFDQGLTGTFAVRLRRKPLIDGSR